MDKERKIKVSPIAHEELNRIYKEGVELSMQELVNWVNDAVARFLPEANSTDLDNRVSPGFTVRTLRHYQTLGCISPPARQGRKAIYGAHQYLQALLIRKYLYLGYTSKQITEKLIGQGVDDCMTLFSEGIDFSFTPPPTNSTNNCTVATWKHITIHPGVELHMRHPLPPLSEDDVDRLLVDIRKAITSS